MMFCALRFDRFVLDLYFNVNELWGRMGLLNLTRHQVIRYYSWRFSGLKLKYVPRAMILELPVPRYDILTEHVNLFDFSIDRRAFDFLSRNNR